MRTPPLNIAVIGSGVAGITASYLLGREHKVTLIEKNDYIGGHTHTIEVADRLNIDTGFIVFNDKTYPNFINFLTQLGVEYQKTDMSFGYFCERTGLQYAGKDINGLFAQRKNFFRPQFWNLLYNIVLFARKASEFIENENTESITLGQFIKKHQFNEDFKKQYIIPMAAAIWSAPDAETLEFPMLNFARFFSNHGLLSFTNRPTWYVVKGGSFSYIKKFLKSFKGEIILNNGVQKIERLEGKIRITLENGEIKSFDNVVIASHADQALKMLQKPTDNEKKLLSKWSYSKNDTILHKDHSVLAPLKRAWAAWNYVRKGIQNPNKPVGVSYYMNLLQGLNIPDNYLVSLNSTEDISPQSIIGKYNYEHPIFNFDSFDTQKYLPDLNGIQNTYFCGSYFGYGFHEDAVLSAVKVAELFGIEL